MKTKLNKLKRYFINKELYKNFPTSAVRVLGLTDEPIIICGAPRSGTTLLMSILDSHPEITVIPFESMIFLERNPLNRYFLKKRLLVKLQLIATLLSIFIKPTSKRWCEKTPQNVMHISFINRLFKGRVKFLHIIRDGRDVVLSSHGRLGKFMSADKWYNYVSAGLEFSNFANVLTIKYEDLVVDFRGTTGRIQQFLDLKQVFTEDFYQISKIEKGTYSNSFLQEVKYQGQGTLQGKITNGRIGKWKDYKDDEALLIFTKSVKAMNLLVKLGYKVE